VFPLKFKPGDQSLASFVEQSLKLELKPYLENDDVMQESLVTVINRENAASILSKTKQSVIVVKSSRCKGC
jgi:hypothetical protein